MNPRTMANGDLVFPRRGSPPPEPIGYVRDSGDPYIMHIAWEFECRFRKLNLFVLPCGKNSVSPYCEHYKAIVNPLLCNDCSFGIENGSDSK